MRKASNFLLAAVFLAGIYCPTSLAGVQSQWLWAAPGFCAIAAFAVIVFRFGLPHVPFVCAMVAMSSLLIFTILTPLWSLTPGALLPYSALLVLMCADFSSIEFEWPLRTAWVLANIVNITLSILIVAGVAPVKTFLVANYSAFYDPLVPNMLAAGKPVLMFASHSIASFFFFVCFYLHLKTFTSRSSTLAFWGAISYLVLLLLLKSISGYCLFLAGAALLLCQTAGRRTVFILAAAIVGFGAGAAFVTTTQWDAGIDAIAQVWNEPGSGFQGRYLDHGVLQQDLKYINDHPLEGVGIGYSESLWYGDSGPVELLIRGSVPLLLAVYIGFWAFLRRNARSKGMAIALFLIYIGFEIAYSNLLYLRTVCVLPLVIVYLNGLNRRTAPVQRLHHASATGPMGLARFQPC